MQSGRVNWKGKGNICCQDQVTSEWGNVDIFDEDSNTVATEQELNNLRARNTLGKCVLEVAVDVSVERPETEFGEL